MIHKALTERLAALEAQKGLALSTDLPARVNEVSETPFWHESHHSGGNREEGPELDDIQLGVLHLKRLARQGNAIHEGRGDKLVLLC
jgi:hypothetical protein